MSRAARRIRSPDVLFADVDLLVIDKPAGLLAGRGNAEAPGAVDALADHAAVRGEDSLQVVNRLDVDGSGVVVFARSTAVRKDLAALFLEKGEEIVTYQALVRGYVDDDGRIELNIVHDKRSDSLSTSERRGKPAVTDYRIAQRVAGNTWLECRTTGARAEQLRAHLAGIGHPLSIDPAYGDSKPLMLSEFKSRYRPSTRHEERPLIDRLTLHVAAVEFVHPRNGANCRFAAEPPKDLRATLRQLGALT